jgi:hypothetical protein
MNTIDKIKSWMLIALLVLGVSVGVSSCSDDDEAPFHTSQLHSFGPCPVLRGETIRIIGEGLSGCTKVIFPVDVEVTDFVSKTDTEIVVTVPQEAVPGHIKLVINGKEVVSKSLITFEEPISVESVSPLENVLAGDEVTVKGDYLYNIASIRFSNDYEITTEDFVAQSRKELRFKVPAQAVDGTITFSDGADWELEWEQPISVKNATYISANKTDVKEGEVIEYTGTNLQLIEAVIFPGNIEVTDLTVSANGTKLSVAVPVGTCNGNVTMRQYNATTLDAGSITVPTISISSVSPTRDLEVGQTVTISGAMLNYVSEVQLPGGDVLYKGQFSVNNAGSALTFTVPATMVDGQIVLVQNSNIILYTETVTMKRLGNVIWTGNFDLGGWSNNLEIAAEKNDTVWETFSAAIKTPGKLTINFEEDMNYGWWQIKPCYRSDWNTLWENVPDIVGMAAGDTSWTVMFTQRDVDAMYGAGLAIGGCYLTIKSIEWEPVSAAPKATRRK